MKHIALLGEGGVGKTTTAQKLIKDLKPKIVISGECPKESNPYDLFYNMLDSFFEIDLFNKRESNELVDQVLEMAGSIMLGPIAGFMSGKNDMSISKQDIFIAIKNKFLEFKEAVVFIDDIQWIDDASKELLKFLFEELKDSDLFFVITSREKEILDELGLENVFELKGLDKVQQFEFLKNNFYLSDEVAEWIINWIDEENATPLELVNVVSSLYRKNYLVKSEYGYVFSEEFNPDLPSVPDNIKEDIKEIFETMPEYKEILSLAAIIGKEFDVSVLADALDMSVIKMTNLLYEISKKTNLVYDVLNKDNIFSFKSQILVDAIKELINYTDKSFLEATAPQIIRFYNQIIAEAMEENNYSDIQIANFYYGAGKTVLHKNFEYQLKAARACKNIFEFEKADKYIVNATTLLQLVDKKEEVEELKLLIEADRQFVRGNIDLDFTNRLIAKTTKNSSDELKIATTRAAYNSGRFDRSYFEKCYELAENYLIPSENKYTKAEGYHFAALSLDNTPENKEKKHKYFTEALKLSKDNKSLYSQIANSYAGFLSFGENHEKLLAKDLFIESIEIKENLPVKDLPGLARAYGGLGRLYLFWESCNCDKAIKYFEKDLQISKELKDEFGISNMYSLLGMAYRLKGDCEKANEYYDKSLELKHNKIDIFASIFGKIACGSDEYDRAKEFIKEYGEPPVFTYNFLSFEDKEKLGLK
jgi:tetratricopeptide (TPR) repeat protein